MLISPEELSKIRLDVLNAENALNSLLKEAAGLGASYLRVEANPDNEVATGVSEEDIYKYIKLHLNDIDMRKFHITASSEKINGDHWCPASFRLSWR